MTTESLWLPILVSAAGVFLLSSLVWTVMPHHKRDFAPPDNEDDLMDAIRRCAGKPGMYYFPFGKWGDRNRKAYLDKVRTGPVGIVRVQKPNAVLNMGPALIKMFLFFLIVSALVAYLASGALEPGAPFLAVFGGTGPAAFLAYGLVGVQESIWFGLPWRVAVKHAIDGYAYALLTGAIFGLLWPSA